MGLGDGLAGHQILTPFRHSSLSPRHQRIKKFPECRVKHRTYSKQHWLVSCELLIAGQEFRRPGTLRLPFFAPSIQFMPCYVLVIQYADHRAVQAKNCQLCSKRRCAIKGAVKKRMTFLYYSIRHLLEHDTNLRSEEM